MLVTRTGRTERLRECLSVILQIQVNTQSSVYLLLHALQGSVCHCGRYGKQIGHEKTNFGQTMFEPESDQNKKKLKRKVQSKE